MNTKYMTEKQTNFIVKLLMERADIIGVESNKESIIDFIGNAKIFTTSDASEFIDKLLAITPNASTKKAAHKSSSSTPNTDHTGVTPVRVISNRYSKPCALCLNEVKTGEGIAVLTDEKQWLTFHNMDCCPAPREGSQLHLAVETWVHQQCLNMGSVYFALPSHTGNNDLDFYSLTASHRKIGSMMVLRRILGGHSFDSSPVVHMTEAKRVIETLQQMSTEQSDDAMKAFADNLGRCFRCGRTLTDDESRERGMGSDCAKKLAMELSTSVF